MAQTTAVTVANTTNAGHHGQGDRNVTAPTTAVNPSPNSNNQWLQRNLGFRRRRRRPAAAPAPVTPRYSRGFQRHQEQRLPTPPILPQPARQGTTNAPGFDILIPLLRHAAEYQWRNRNDPVFVQLHGVQDGRVERQGRSSGRSRSGGRDGRRG